MKLFAITMLCALAVVAGLLWAPERPEPGGTEGYMVSSRSVYDSPYAQSRTIGVIAAGDRVRLEHIHSLVYRVHRAGEKVASGYVVFPKLSDRPPTLAEMLVQPVRSSDDPSEMPSPRLAEPAEATADVMRTPVERRYVRNFIHIRTGPSASSRPYAQLLPGAEVMVSVIDSAWCLVYKPNETTFEPDRALGFVHLALLFDVSPTSR